MYKESYSPPTSSPDIELLTIHEIAEILNVSYSWTRAAVFKNKIPYVKVGRLVRFCKKDIEAWIKSNKRETESLEKGAV